jgi:hypothetical protein
LHRIRDCKFNQEQIGWINEAGLGALLGMSDFSVPVNLVAWIMKHIDPDLREFRRKDKVIVFDKQLICNILGVPSGDEPVKLTCNADEYEAFLKIREPFMVGVRGKLSQCIDVLKTANDKTTFLRAFMLLALGSVLCPGTDNAITPRYLHNLKDVSLIRSFDWAGHILDNLMNEVRKYQSFSKQDEGATECPYLGSCLVVFAVCSLSLLCCTHPYFHCNNFADLFQWYYLICCISYLYMFDYISFHILQP